MKTIKNVLRVSTLALLVAVMVAFFFKFAEIAYITADGTAGSLSITGAQAIFGDETVTLVDGTVVQLYHSLYYLVVGFLIALTAVLAGLSFKRAKVAFGALGVGIVATIMYGVYVFSSASKYVDTRGIAMWPSLVDSTVASNLPYYDMVSGRYLQSVEYQPAAYVIFGLMVAFVILCAATILVADAYAIKTTGQLSLIGKIKKFFRDYKNEVKKIVWPTKAKVIRNSVTVFVMVALVGLFIAIVDVGLTQLIEFLLGLAETE